MAGYNDDPVQDYIREFMDITESSGDNVEADLESHVKVKKQASKTTTNKGKGKKKGNWVIGYPITRIEIIGYSITFGSGSV